MEKIYLTVKEIAERTGKSIRSVYSRLEYMRLPGKRDGLEKRFPVTEEYLTVLSGDVPDCVTAQQLAERTGLSAPTVRKRLRLKDIFPVLIGINGLLYYKDQEDLDKLLLEVPPPNFHPQVKKKKEDDIAPEMRAMLDEAEDKKKWIGKPGKLVDGTRVMYEGIIESVSICGCVVGGHVGCLKELQLA